MWADLEDADISPVPVKSEDDKGSGGNSITWLFSLGSSLLLSGSSVPLEGFRASIGSSQGGSSVPTGGSILPLRSSGVP